MMKFVKQTATHLGLAGGAHAAAVAGDADAEAGADGGQAIADELQRSNDEYSFHSFLL